ncbi:hypothetical protein BDZ94DRAFT_1266814 [Collybia nuda]|uniref:F-box domain-containing protein n=1 Tax=Collybia nuda TaxID=64659 RepID=A0A9P5Y289_9AGAR|nr:hypothetical protein BDZ94DRAFT_1266814 [Collybia nuda]
MSMTRIVEMPTEILVEIFYLLCPGTIMIPSVVFDTLWSTAQTCSRWRSVALGLYRLWSDLSITFEGKHHAVVYFAKQCFLRSRHTHISLQITEKTPYALNDISFLVPHSARIKSLSITARGKLSFMPLPSLELLEIKALPYPSTIMDQTPALTELRTDDELPFVVVEGISKGTLWPHLRLIDCNVSAWSMDKYLEMLQSRVERNLTTSSVNITEAVIRCRYFRASDGQWEKVRMLRGWGLHITVEENVVDQAWFLDISESSESSGYTSYDDDGYNSDNIRSLGI